MNIRDITQRIKWDKDASDSTKRRTVKRIQTIADAIEARFPGVRYGNQIHLKHMRYIKEVWFEHEDLVPTTSGDYTRAMRLMISAREKEKDCVGRLGLLQDLQRGGEERGFTGNENEVTQSSMNAHPTMKVAGFGKFHMPSPLPAPVQISDDRSQVMRVLIAGNTRIHNLNRCTQ